jgi:type I restriction enzyme S subunit
MSWSTVPLGELSRPKQWGVLSKSQMLPSGYSVYGANGVIGHSSVFTHEEPVLAIGCRGTIGAVHLTAPRSFVTSNAMALDELDAERVDVRYLARFLRWRGFADVTTGTSQPQLTRQSIVTVRVPLPELEEQQRIAAILDAAVTIRTKRRAQLAHLDELPATVFFERFLDGQSFPAVALKHAVKWSSGKFLPAKAQREGDFPVYGGNGKSGCHDEYMHEEPRLVVGRVGAYCGAVHVTAPKSWVTDNALIGTLLRDDLELSYLEQTLRLANLNQFAATSGQPSISAGRIGDVGVPLAPIEMQRRYADDMRAIVAQRTEIARALRIDEELFAALQHRAFRGEL